MTGCFRHLLARGVFLEAGSFLSKILLLRGEFGSWFCFWFERFFGRAQLHLLLILDNFFDLFLQLLQISQLLLRLFHFRDLLAELLIGPLQGFNRGLLSGCIVLAFR